MKRRVYLAQISHQYGRHLFLPYSVGCLWAYAMTQPELADALETTGEHTRALAVLLDLVAEQSDYRDARARIERLSRVKA